jgi:hypothetical protein
MSPSTPFHGPCLEGSDFDPPRKMTDQRTAATRPSLGSVATSQQGASIDRHRCASGSTLRARGQPTGSNACSHSAPMAAGRSPTHAEHRSDQAMTAAIIERGPIIGEPFSPVSRTHQCAQLVMPRRLVSVRSTLRTRPRVVRPLSPTTSQQRQHKDLMIPCSTDTPRPSAMVSFRQRQGSRCDVNSVAHLARWDGRRLCTMRPSAKPSNHNGRETLSNSQLRSSARLTYRRRPRITRRHRAHAAS